ncbi:hypothetical protein ACKWTF_012576 [Chironomus riparius]
MRFYKIECSSDNETKYLENIDCKIHSNKIGSMFFSGVADLVVPISSININFMVIYRSLNKTMMNITFDYCGSYNNLPPYIHIIFNIYKKYSNNLIHECPYAPKKRIGLENLPLDVLSKVFAVVNFQRGDYKAVIDVRDDNENLIIHVDNYLTVSQKKTPKQG